MEPQPAKQPIAWGPVAGVVGTIVIFFLAQIAAVAILAVYAGAQNWSDARTDRWFEESVYAQFSLALLVDVLSLQLLYFFLKSRKSNFRALGLKAFRARDLAYALSGYAVYFVSYLAAIIAITNFIPQIDTEQRQELGFRMDVAGPELAIVFVSLVILPPIIEEVLFRGFLYTGLRQKLPFIISALVTSAIFAVAHLQFGSGNPLLWIAAIDTFFLSMVLVYLREKTGSLAAPILLHALKNGIAFMTLFVFRLG